MYILINDNIKLSVTKITETYFYNDNSYELLCENNEIRNIDDCVTLLKPLENIDAFSIKVFSDEDIFETSYNNYSIDRIENYIMVGEYNTIVTFKKQ